VYNCGCRFFDYNIFLNSFFVVISISCTQICTLFLVLKTDEAVYGRVRALVSGRRRSAGNLIPDANVKRNLLNKVLACLNVSEFDKQK
jgi:hypothetical protein